MSVAICGLGVGVIKELADDWKPLPHSDTMGGVGVAEIIDAHVIKTCGLPDAPPGLLDIHQVLLVDVTCDDERIVIDLGCSFEFLDCGLTKVDRLLAGLGVRARAKSS